MPVRFELDAARARRVLLAIVAGLCALDVFTLVARFGLGRDTVFGLVRFLDFGRENNLPSWYATVQLALAALVLSVVAVRTRRAGGRFVLAWALLAAGFAYLSLDEMVQLHEYWGLALEGRVERSGIFFYRWVVIAIPLVLAMLAVFGRFLLALPPRLRTAMVAAGALYVASAVGLELVQAWLESTYGVKGLLFETMTLLEEGGELTAIALFISALLRHLADPAPAAVEQRVSAPRAAFRSPADTVAR